jgi:hypothetical protein
MKQAQLPIADCLLVSSSVRTAVLGSPLRLEVTPATASSARHCLTRLPERQGGTALRIDLCDRGVDASEQDILAPEVHTLLSTACQRVTHFRTTWSHPLLASSLEGLNLIMPKLQRLEIGGNIHLTRLCLPVGLPSLSSITVDNCSALTHVDVSTATQLTRVDFMSTKHLSALDVSGCTALEHLWVSDSALTVLPLQPQHNRLRYLFLYNIPHLKSLDLSHCTALRELDAWMPGFTRLVLPPACELDRLKLATLKLLTLANMSKLVRVSEVVCTANDHAPELELLSRIPGLRAAELLEWWNAPNAWAPTLPTLLNLMLYRCDGLMDLDLRGATSLTQLDVCECDDLESIKVPQSLQQLACTSLPSLCDMDLTGAPGVEADFENCKALTQLRSAKITFAC